MEHTSTDAALSRIPVKVDLPCGNQAVYMVQAQHLPREDASRSASWPMAEGKKIAHTKNGLWFLTGDWRPVNDQKLLKLLEEIKPSASPVAHEGRSSRNMRP